MIAVDIGIIAIWTMAISTVLLCTYIIVIAVLYAVKAGERRRRQEAEDRAAVRRWIAAHEQRSWSGRCPAPTDHPVAGHHPQRGER